MNYLTLGNIKFQGLKGFDSFDPSSSINYTQHPLIEGKPRLQYSGTNLKTISGTISFHRQFCVPETEMRTLADAMNNRVILPLVYGNGVYVGDFVIESIGESIKQTFSNGNILHVVLDISLLENYDPDKLKTLEAKYKAEGFAADPLTAIPIVKPPNPPMYTRKEVADRVRGVSVQAGAINGSISKSKTFPDQLEYYSKQVNKSLNTVDENTSKIRQLITSADILGTADDFGASLDAMSRFTQDFLNIMPDIGSNDAVRINKAFQDSVRSMSISSLSVVKRVIVRRFANG